MSRGSFVSFLHTAIGARFTLLRYLLSLGVAAEALRITNELPVCGLLIAGWYRREMREDQRSYGSSSTVSPQREKIALRHTTFELSHCWSYL